MNTDTRNPFYIGEQVVHKGERGTILALDGLMTYVELETGKRVWVLADQLARYVE